MISFVAKTSTQTQTTIDEIRRETLEKANKVDIDPLRRDPLDPDTVAYPARSQSALVQTVNRLPGVHPLSNRLSH